MDNNFEYFVYLVIIGISSYLIWEKIVENNDKIIKFIKRLKDYDIYIISDDVCSCNKLYKYLPKLLGKCYKCRCNNIINIEDSDDIMYLLENITGNKKCEIILHTHGGSCDASDSLSLLLKDSEIEINIYIPRYAFSAGTMIMLSANNIFMNWYSLASPVDTQMDYNDDEVYSSKYIEKMADKSWVENKEFLLAEEAKAIIAEDTFIINKLLEDNPNKSEIIKKLLFTKFSHEFNYTRKDLIAMELPVIGDIPSYIMDTFNKYTSHF